MNLKKCEVCGGHFEELARILCGHEYCRECLSTYFQAAINGQSPFPPQCCGGPISLDENVKFLDVDTVTTFRQKALEMSTPNRTYCQNVRCGGFIAPANYANGVATCKKCAQKTCIECKGAAHAGSCPHHDQLQQIIKLAEEQKWQRCPNCSTFVERITGCEHIVCRCGSEFCYLCGAPWETCKCVDNYYQLARHEAVLELEMAGAPIDQRVPAINRQERMRRLIATQHEAARLLGEARRNLGRREALQFQLQTATHTK